MDADLHARYGCVGRRKPAASQQGGRAQHGRVPRPGHGHAPNGPAPGRDAAQLAEVPSWPGRFELTDALLTRRYAAGPSVDPEVAWAWYRIIGSRGLVRIDGLAAEVGWSRKRLWYRFRSQLGLPPKRAATPVRFDHAAWWRARPGSRPTPTAPTSPICIVTSWRSPGRPRRPRPANGFSPLTTSHGPSTAHPPVRTPPRTSGPAAGQRREGVRPAAASTGPRYAQGARRGVSSLRAGGTSAGCAPCGLA